MLFEQVRLLLTTTENGVITDSHMKADQAQKQSPGVLEQRGASKARAVVLGIAPVVSISPR